MDEEEDASVVKGKHYVHVRVQQRNGRKSLTTVQARAAAAAAAVVGEDARLRTRRALENPRPTRVVPPGGRRDASRLGGAMVGGLTACGLRGWDALPSVVFRFSRAWLTRPPRQGIDPTVDYKKVLKAFKKEFCCNGTVVEDPEQGHVIQLQGDQRKNVSTFLINEKIVKKDAIKSACAARLALSRHRSFSRAAPASPRLLSARWRWRSRRRRALGCGHGAPSLLTV